MQLYIKKKDCELFHGYSRSHHLLELGYYFLDTPSCAIL